MSVSYTPIKANILAKIGSFQSILLFVKFITGLISMKVIAIFLGPDGMAFIGNLRNLLTAVKTISILSMYDGVVHRIAEFKRQKREMKKILSTTYYVGYVMTYIIAFILYYAADFWNTLMFGDTYVFVYVFEAMAIALPLYATNTLCMAIISGFSKTKIYIIITIISSLLGLFVTVLLITEMKLEGAFLAIVLNPAISLLITIIIIVNQRNLMKLVWADRISLSYFRKLVPHMSISFVTVGLIPIALIQIRNYIIATDGITNAGYWEAMQRWSHQYLYCFGAILTLYLLPKLTRTTKSVQLKKEILKFYKLLLPIIILSLVGFYMTRTFWIKIVLSDEFLSMSPLFIWQLLGDFFNIISMTIVYILIAKKKYWHFVFAKILLFIVLYGISFYCIQKYGFIGGSMGYCISYMLFTIFVLLLCSRWFFPFHAIFSKNKRMA